MSSGTPVFCFDLDDTLVSERDYVESGLRAAGALVDAAAPGGEPAGEWLVASWRRDHGRDCFQRLLRERGLAADAWVPRLVDAYRGHAPVLRPRPGVPEVLAKLAASGARLALISDGYLEVQSRKWAALRLSLAFDPIVFTDQRGRAYWKPHPWAFEHVMQAHASAARFLYVGDNVEKDFIAPNRLGWTTILVRHEHNLHPAREAAGDAAPALVVDTFASLLELS